MENTNNDIINKRVGLLTIVEEADRDKWGHRQLLCRCDCGNYVTIRYNNVIYGKTKSCGCNKSEVMKLNGKNKKLNKYKLDSDLGYGIGYLANGEEFYFDLEDYDKIKNYLWHISSDKKIIADLSGNKNLSEGKKRKHLHRFLMNEPENMYVKHINGNTLDNRKCNLKIISRTDAYTNRAIRSDNKSGVSGVCQNAYGSWMVQIKGKYYGTFKNKDDAIDKANEIRNISKDE